MRYRITIKDLSEIPVVDIPLSLRFHQSITRDVDSLRGVIRGLTGKHERRLKWLYENPGKSAKYYRFVDHQLVANKILDFRVRFLHPKFLRFRDYILRGLKALGEEGIIDKDRKVRFDLMTGAEKKMSYKPVKFDKNIEISFKTPVIYNVYPWNILRNIGSKIYQIYRIEIPEMESIKEKAGEWPFKSKLSRYIFRRKGYSYWGWRG